MYEQKRVHVRANHAAPDRTRLPRADGFAGTLPHRPNTMIERVKRLPRKAACSAAQAARNAHRGLQALQTPEGSPPNLLPTYVFFGVSFFQVLLMTILTCITGTRLELNGQCLLDKSNDLCLFVYTSYPWIFVLILFVVVRAVMRVRKRRCGPVLGFFTISWSIYSWFFYVAVAVSALKGGDHATAAGLPRTSDRRAVIGLAWMVDSLFLVVALVAGVDTFLNWSLTPEFDLGSAYVLTRDETRSTVYTRALGKNSFVPPQHSYRRA